MQPLNKSIKSNIQLLQSGSIIKHELLPECSNAAFLIDISTGPQNVPLKAVYKPQSGETPLWDFSGGTLYKREYAAFLVSRELGWPSIPDTAIREGPFGIGSVQLYIPHKPNINYFDLINTGFKNLDELAVFDILINNADRKAGHCILGLDKTLWSIDHGLCFHSEFKVRTVMLEFWGSEIKDRLITSLNSLAEKLSRDSKFNQDLHIYISDEEILSLISRISSLIDTAKIPLLNPHHNVPWPLI